MAVLDWIVSLPWCGWLGLGRVLPSKYLAYAVLTRLPSLASTVSYPIQSNPIQPVSRSERRAAGTYTREVRHQRGGHGVCCALLGVLWSGVLC